jgi:triosephosphate isomerase
MNKSSSSFLSPAVTSRERIYRKKIIAGNWKMHCTAADARTLVRDLLVELGNRSEAEVVVCPPFTALAAVAELLQSVSHVRIGAQNMHPAASGAYTGEISASMLKDLHFGESDVFIAQKLRAALDANFKPILCVGETLEDREAALWQSTIGTQLRQSLDLVQRAEATSVVIAYEPIWAIGTGKNASPLQAQEVHAWIREFLAKQFDAEAASRMRIQYGGSVKPDNSAALLCQPDIDGLLVGGASLDARGFATIIKSAGNSVPTA